MEIELVIFDCDGVLVDSEAITTATLVDALAPFGLSWDAAELTARYRGVRLDRVLAIAESQIGEPLPASFLDDFRVDLFERLRSDVAAIPGVKAALDRIPHPICVASNGPIAKMEATLGATGLLERFRGRMFSAYDVGSFKPDPGLFLHAAAALRAAPERCVVVEDSVSGIRAARAAGMRALAYLGEEGNLDAAGARTFRSMNALPALLS